MYDHFEIYPDEPEKTIQWDKPFFVEITRWKKGDKMHWRLFQRSFIFSREDWENQMKDAPANDFAALIMGPEGHPYQLANGEVNEHPGVIAMETPEFLKFMVDAMNEKAEMKARMERLTKKVMAEIKKDPA
jgi:hypothetical protein